MHISLSELSKRGSKIQLEEFVSNTLKSTLSEQEKMTHIVAMILLVLGDNIYK